AGGARLVEERVDLLQLVHRHTVGDDRAVRVLDTHTVPGQKGDLVIARLHGAERADARRRCGARPAVFDRRATAQREDEPQGQDDGAHAAKYPPATPWRPTRRAEPWRGAGLALGHRCDPK